MKRDIKNRKDIEKLVNLFYDKIKTDAVIGYFFNEVSQVNWETHLPIMYDFWENILFYTGNYNGNPMHVHTDLNKKSTMNVRHFKQWNKLFVASVEKLFEGPKAEEIKNRAMNISGVLMNSILL